MSKVVRLGPDSDCEIVFNHDGSVTYTISRWDRHMKGRDHFMAGAVVKVDSCVSAAEFTEWLREEGFTIPEEFDYACGEELRRV